MKSLGSGQRACVVCKMSVKWKILPLNGRRVKREDGIITLR